MDELYEWLEGNIEIPAKCIVLTSDDGQENFFELFQPELHKYGFRATSFVITAWRKNLPYKLTLPNVELHSHTHDMHKGQVSKGGVPENRGMMQGVSVEYGVKDLTKSSQLLNGINRKLPRVIVKALVFNAGALLSVALAKLIFAVPVFDSDKPVWLLAAAYLIAANICFALYDRALLGFYTMYDVRLAPLLGKLLKS